MVGVDCCNWDYSSGCSSGSWAATYSDYRLGMLGCPQVNPRKDSNKGSLEVRCCHPN